MRHIISDQEFLTLYKQGLNDREIALKTGASASQIMRRRNKFNLPAIGYHNKLDTCFMKLYKMGLTDSEISRQTNIPVSNIQSYRVKKQLPVNSLSVYKEKIPKLIQQGKTDSEIGQLLGKAPSTIKRWRQKMGFIRVRKTSINYQPTPLEEQVLIGSLLGDGNLTRQKGNKRGTIFSVSHCLKQKEYIEFKHDILKRTSSPITLYTFNDNRFNKQYQEYSFRLHSNTQLNKMFENWYTPKKKIYKEDLYKLEGLGLAIWYMDDGYKPKYGGCFISTNCFSFEDLEIIKKMFLEKFNIHVTYNSKHITYIPAKEFPKFVKLIKPYIIPSMKYKLGNKSHCKTPLNGETPVIIPEVMQDNPVPNPLEIKENV